jgi:hypothetical protein
MTQLSTLSHETKGADYRYVKFQTGICRKRLPVDLGDLHV